MNPTETLPAEQKPLDFEKQFADGPTISKHLLLGWLIGHGVNLPWSATNGQIFAGIKKACQRAFPAEPGPNPADATVLANNISDPMNQLDLSKLTPEQAGELFLMRCEEIVKATGCTLERATERAKLLHADLYARVNARADRPAGISGIEKEMALANAQTSPVFGPQNKTLLGLPADADPEECAAAFRGNGGVMSPRNSKAIWDALRSLMSGRMTADHGGNPPSYIDALIDNKMRERYPLLAQAAA